MATKFQMLAPMPAEAFVERLRTIVDSDWRFFGNRPAVGRVDSHRLRIRKRIGYRNSFQAVLTAEIVPQGGTTLLRCRLGEMAFVRGFALVWIALAGGMAALIVTASIGNSVPMPALLGVAAMPFFGIGIVWFGRRLARGEAEWLLDWMRQETGATRIS